MTNLCAPRIMSAVRTHGICAIRLRMSVYRWLASRNVDPVRTGETMDPSLKRMSSIGRRTRWCWESRRGTGELTNLSSTRGPTRTASGLGAARCPSLPFRRRSSSRQSVAISPKSKCKRHQGADRRSGDSRRAGARLDAEPRCRRRGRLHQAGASPPPGGWRSVVRLNWYLTPDETHNADGKHVAYVEPGNRQHARLKACDPDLMQCLSGVVAGSRSVRALEDSGALLSAR